MKKSSKAEIVEKFAGQFVPFRLTEIQKELDLMFSTFPQNFPNGAAVVAPLQKKPLKPEQVARAARKMVEAATPKGSNGKTLVTTKEAAALLGVTTSGVTYHVKKGNLKIKKKDPIRFRREDVKALKGSQTEG